MITELADVTCASAPDIRTFAVKAHRSGGSFTIDLRRYPWYPDAKLFDPDLPTVLTFWDIDEYLDMRQLLGGPDHE